MCRSDEPVNDTVVVMDDPGVFLVSMGGYGYGRRGGARTVLCRVSWVSMFARDWTSKIELNTLIVGARSVAASSSGGIRAGGRTTEAYGAAPPGWDGSSSAQL